MHRQFLLLLGATEASSTYGHGACVAPAGVDELRRLSRLSCKDGDHVAMHSEIELKEKTSRRLGPRHELKLQLISFRVILSVAVSNQGHINLEEAQALLRYVRWILRSKTRLCRRIVILVDSQVVIWAVTKGRSGSAPLNRLLRKLAAVTFAGGLILHCIFVPSAHNPSDWPSRGGPATWPEALRRPRGRVWETNKRLRRELEELRRERTHLEGMLRKDGFFDPD